MKTISSKRNNLPHVLHRRVSSCFSVILPDYGWRRVIFRLVGTKRDEPLMLPLSMESLMIPGTCTCCVFVSF